MGTTCTAYEFSRARCELHHMDITRHALKSGFKCYKHNPSPGRRLWESLGLGLSDLAGTLHLTPPDIFVDLLGISQTDP